MVKPYLAVAMQPEVRHCRTRVRVQDNLDRCLKLIDMIHRMDSGAGGLPVRLVTFPEFFLQGFLMPIIPHSQYVKDVAITIPGEETEKLGQKAKEYNYYICGAALAVEPEWPDRFFNVAFIVGPDGKVIHKYHKLNTTNNSGENSISPHDMYDAFVKKYGDSLDAFFPVADTEIGKLAPYICADSMWPECARGLAMNGAEVILSITASGGPGHSTPASDEGTWYLTNRARAVDNLCYMVAPNWGGTLGDKTALMRAFTPGGAMIVDFRGRVLASANFTGESFVWAEIDIELLRECRAKSRMGNNLATLRSELYAKIYEKPRFPKNRYLEKPPETVLETRPLIDECVQRCVAEGIFTPPASEG